MPKMSLSEDEVLLVSFHIDKNLKTFHKTSQNEEIAIIEVNLDYIVSAGISGYNRGLLLHHEHFDSSQTE